MYILIKRVYNILMVLQQTNMFEESTKIVFSKPKTSSRHRDELLLSQKYEQLYEIYNQIYETLNIDIFEQREVIIIGKTIIAYPEEKQAEVMGTQFLPLEERIRRNHDYLEKIEICNKDYNKHLEIQKEWHKRDLEVKEAVLKQIKDIIYG